MWSCSIPHFADKANEDLGGEFCTHGSHSSQGQRQDQGLLLPRSELFLLDQAASFIPESLQGKSYLAGGEKIVITSWVCSL